MAVPGTSTTPARDPITSVVLAVGAALVVLFAGASTALAVGHTVPTELWAAAGALSGALVGVLVPPGGDAAITAASAAAHDQAHRSALQQAGAAAQTKVDQAAPAEKPAAQAATAAAIAAVTAALKPSVDASSVTSARMAASAAATEVQTQLTMAAARAAQDHAVAVAEVKAQGENRTDDAVAAQSATEMQSAVLSAAAKGAADAHDETVQAGVNAAAKSPSAWDWKAIVTLIVGIVALVFAYLVANGVGSGSPASPHDNVFTGLADTLVALGSAAVGAALGIKAPLPVAAPAPPRS
jgi:hypothetical protein